MIGYIDNDLDKYIGTLICTKSHIRYSMHGELKYLKNVKYKCEFGVVRDVVKVFNDNGCYILSSYNYNTIIYLKEFFMTVVEYRKTIIDNIEY